MHMAGRHLEWPLSKQGRGSRRQLKRGERYREKGQSDTSNGSYRGTSDGTLARDYGVSCVRQNRKLQRCWFPKDDAPYPVPEAWSSTSGSYGTIHLNGRFAYCTL